MSLTVHPDRPIRPARGTKAVARFLDGLPPIVRAMRPLQWTKNGIVAAALVFDRKLFEIEPALRSLLAILCFCAVSSAIYLINDLKDIEADRHHPTKRFRPIAAGEVSPRFALVVALSLLAAALVGAAINGLGFLAVIAGYAWRDTNFVWRVVEPATSTSSATAVCGTSSPATTVLASPSGATFGVALAPNDVATTEIPTRSGAPGSVPGDGVLVSWPSETISSKISSAGAAGASKLGAPTSVPGRSVTAGPATCRQR